jgi:hypothetical protein
VKLRNGIAAGIVSLAAAGLASPAYAATAPAVHRSADNCWLNVNVAHPAARDWETLTVGSAAPRTTVQVHIRYRTVSHTWDITTGRNGRAVYQFNVGHPTRNWRVTLAGTVVGAPRGYRTGETCVTSFVPR